ncbi:MAG: hypothetical protein HY236_04400 [Acidobacteria bacterium]|nr:hypothetical protein [Acidobacteriota bacterium]
MKAGRGGSGKIIKIAKTPKKSARPKALPELPYRSKLGRARIRKAVLAVIKARIAKNGAVAR